MNDWRREEEKEKRSGLNCRGDEYLYRHYEGKYPSEGHSAKFNLSIIYQVITCFDIIFMLNLWNAIFYFKLFPFIFNWKMLNYKNAFRIHLILFCFIYLLLLFSGGLWYLFTLLFVYTFAFICVLFFTIHIITSHRRMQAMLGCPSVRGTEERKHPKYVCAYARIKIRSVTFFFYFVPNVIAKFF